MNLEEDYLIERFLKGELSEDEKEQMETRMVSDPEFSEKVALERQLFKTFDEEDWSDIENPDKEVEAYAELFGAQESKTIKSAIASSAATYKRGKTKTLRKPVWLYAAAATIILVLSFYFLWPAGIAPEELYHTYLDKTELPSLVTRGDSAPDQMKAQAYFENQKYREAVQLFADLIENGGQNGAFYIYLSLAQAELGEFSEALATLDKLIQSDLLDSEKGYWYKSLVYLKADQPQDAKSLLELIIEKNYYQQLLAESLLDEL